MKIDCKNCGDSYKLVKEGFSVIGYNVRNIGFCTLFCLREHGNQLSIKDLSEIE